MFTRMIVFILVINTMFRHCPFMDHSLVMAEGLVQLSEAISNAMQGHARQTGHSDEF